MPFDLESALSVKERDDGLMEKVGSFDLNTATPAPVIPEIRAAKPGEIPYGPPANKDQAVVELSYKQAGQEVPLGIKADWLLTSPQAKAVTQTVLAPELTVLQGIRGAIQNSGQYDLIGNILKGIVEPDKTKKFYENIPGTENMPGWAHTVVGIAEDIAGLGFIGAGKTIIKNNLLVKDIMYKVDVAADQFAQEAISKAEGAIANPEAVIADIKNGFKVRTYQKLAALEPEVISSESAVGLGESAAPSQIQQYAQRRSLLGLVLDEFKRMGESGELRIPKVGETVQFNSQGELLRGVIKQIEGERAIIKMGGREVVATLNQIMPQPQETTPRGEKNVEYGMQHRPTEGPPANDLLAKVDGGDFAPKDIYEHPEWYANGDGSLADRQSISAIQKLRGKPEAMVTIYRASPKNELNGGDWVSLSRDYAKGESLSEGVKVYSFRVKASDVKWAGDSLNEFGYFGKPILQDLGDLIIELNREASYILKKGKIPPNADMSGFKKSKFFNKYGTTAKQQASAYYAYIDNKKKTLFSPTVQPSAGGLIHELDPQTLAQIKKIHPDITKGVNLTQDITVKDIFGNTKIYKKGESIFIYEDSKTGKAIVKDGNYGVLQGGQVDKVEQAGNKWGGAESPGGGGNPVKPKIDLSNLPQLQKQIQEMKDREAKVEISHDALDEINTVRKAFRHRISKYSGKVLAEELQGIPAIYIIQEGGIKPDEAIAELKNYGVNLANESELKSYLIDLEATKKSLEADIETEKPGFITKRETTLLKDKIKAVEMGFRAGTVKTKQQVKDLQSEFISAIEDLNVPTTDKWRIIKTLKNVQTPEQFSKILNEVTERLSNIQIQAERMSTIGDIKKLFKKQPTESLPLQYKDQIDEIMAKIDPRQRASSTKKKIESLRSFVARMEAEGEDVNIPEYKLSLLEKKSLDEFDTEELKALQETLEQLVHQGRLYNKLLTGQKDKEFAQVAKSIVSDILKGKELNADSSFIKAIREHNKSLKDASLEKVKDFIYANLRPELMINLLGKYPTEVIFKPLVKADTSEVSEGEAHTKKLWDIHKAIDVPKAYVKKFDVGKYKGVTKNNALFIYANSLNEGQLRHLMASGLTEEDIQLFSNSLTPEERQAVENLWKYYDSEQWPRLDKVYSEINGAHINKEDNYFPIMNLEEVSESYTKELQNEMLKRFHLRQASPTKGFTKERVASAKAFSNFDYFGTVVRNHEQVEHYIAFAEAVRDANKVLRNPEIRQAIIQKSGKEYLKILDVWLKDTAYGGSQHINNMLDKFSLFFTRNYVTSVLGYNLISASKSLVSFMTGVDKIGEAETIRAIGKFMQNPVKLTQFVYSKSEMMKHRDFTQEKEFKSIMAGREAYLGQAKLWQKFKEWSSIPMMLSDKVTVIPLWCAAYQDVLDKGNILTNPNLEQEAIEAADTLIRRTQPMGRALHLPDTFRGGAFQNAYTLFTNQINQNFNREYEQTTAFLNKDIKQKEWLKTQLYLVVLSGLMIGMIARRRFPKWKELIYDSISQLSGGVFLLGNISDAILMSLLTKQKGDIGKSLTPKSFGALSELGQALTSRTGKGRMKHAISAAGALTGFPYIQGGRVLQTLDDVSDFIGEELGQ